MRGGTFNLKYGRPPERVAGECHELFGEYGLTFLAVQEADDYLDVLADRFHVIGSGESVLLVERGVPVDRVRRHVYGDGWTTVRGGHFPPAVHWQARLAGWLRVRSVHLPTPSEWRDGHPVAPPDRLDDLFATAVGLRWFLRGTGARLAVGDWNEPPTTRGRYSPSWIAEEGGATIHAPESSTGHGRIDYAIASDCRVDELRIDDQVTEFSDHEPVIFRVRRSLVVTAGQN